MKATQLSVITKTAGPQTCAFWHLRIWIWKHTVIFRPGLWLGIDYRIKGTLRPDLIIFHSIHGTHTLIFMVRKLCVYPQFLAELNFNRFNIYCWICFLHCFWCYLFHQKYQIYRHFCRWLCAGDHWLEDNSAPSVICEVMLQSQLALAGQLQHSPSVVMGYVSHKRRDGALGSRGCFSSSSHPSISFIFLMDVARGISSEWVSHVPMCQCETKSPQSKYFQ